MGTFHLQIDDFDQDPTDAIASITAQDEKAGHLASHGYGMAKAYAQLLGCTHASVSGGWIPLPDGTDSITVNVGMQTGASELAYHQRVLQNLLKGPDTDGAPVGQHSPAGLPQPDHVPGGGRGDAADHPTAVLGERGTAGTGGPDHAIAGRVGAGGDAQNEPELDIVSAYPTSLINNEEKESDQ